MILPICCEKEDEWFKPARRELVRQTGKQEEDKTEEEEEESPILRTKTSDVRARICIRPALRPTHRPL